MIDSDREMETTPLVRRRGSDRHKLLTDPMGFSQSAKSSWFKRITMLWLVGMLLLLPLDFVKLPLNMTPVDCWILAGLPVLWLSYVRGHHFMNLSYTVAIWVILLASFASTFAAPAPKNALVVILKEVYAFAWFVTLVAIIPRLSAREHRRLLIVWSAVVFLHGFVLIAQFLSPSFWRLMVGVVGKSDEFDIYRPSGLFMNANSAAFFQLLGFVPLVLVSPSKNIGMILSAILLPTMLVTGSMGAALAFAIGVMVAVAAIFFSGKLLLIIKMLLQLTIGISILGGLLYLIITHNERYQAHIDHILLGRAERSSEGRFYLWQRGLDVFVEHNVFFLWGVGPENFREVDGRGKQLHNDFLAFTVERGLLGTVGLLLFAALAVGRAAYIVVLHNKHPDRAQLAVVVFLGAVVATIIESLTHQTFHFRELWLVLAFQEATFFKMTAAKNAPESTAYVLKRLPGRRPEFDVQPDVISG